MLYESAEALPLVYSVDNLATARAEQARSPAQLNAIRGEDLRKTRIPITIVPQVHDEIFQALAATLNPFSLKAEYGFESSSASLKDRIL
jgi:hypothetical protein